MTNRKKKVCFRCYQEAILYQPPELGLKPLAMFPEQLTEDTSECEVHGWLGSEIWQELLSWIED